MVIAEICRFAVGTNRFLSQCVAVTAGFFTHCFFLASLSLLIAFQLLAAQAFLPVWAFWVSLLLRSSFFPSLA